MFNTPPKTAPGKLRMACRIWEPQPVSKRKQQEEVFVYNGNTLQFFRLENQRVAGGTDYIRLRERYVHYDTFLTIAGNPLQSNRADFLNFDGTDLYTNGEPVNPWQYHQTFTLTGSFFSPVVFDPSGEVIETSNNIEGLSQWTYSAIEVPEDTPGKDGLNNQDIFDSSSIDPEDQDKLNYAAWRKTHRFIPMQVAGPLYLDASIRNTSAAATVGQLSGKPVHWLALKSEKLYSNQDFWVQFKKGAFFTNAASTKDKFTRYLELDANSRPSHTVDGVTIYNNMGVVGFGPDGTPDPDSKDSINLARQPYYCIEINHGDADQNFWVIIPFNSHPVFIHRSKVPIKIPGIEDPNEPSNSTPPQLVVPEQLVSRRLSTWDVAIGRKLMEQEFLTVTVRNHQGKLIITFSGFEDQPWLIERYDYNYDKYQADPTQFILEPENCRVRPFPIQIGAGNALCGFSFAPLHYEQTGWIEQPETIAVKGPVEETDLNLLLGEKEQYRTAATMPERIFTQDAELYIEIQNGKPTLTAKPDTVDPSEAYWRIRGIQDLTKDDLPRDYTDDISVIPVDDAGKISYIRIQHLNFALAKDFLSNPDAVDTDNIPDDLKTKQFHARMVLGAGDMVIAKGDSKKEWIIPNCITPIANGWRLLVEPSGETHDVCPFEAAQHVIHCSVNSSYTDNIKVEHSGTIKFIMNFGQMTGTSWANNNTDSGQGGSGDDSACKSFEIGDPRSYEIDQSVVLSNLSGKSFWIRIYAWWDDGFMDCRYTSNSDNPTLPAITTCNCGTKKVVGDPRIIFTGLAHGGGITVENGKRYMECQLLDYWKILEDAKFLNSPFFDGMRDFNAVNEILKMAGFSATVDTVSNRNPDPYPPAAFSELCSNTDQTHFTVSSAGGEKWWQTDFALPSAYDILQNPILKFSETSDYSSAIVNIAQKSGKMVFFDRYGEFKLVRRSDMRLCDMGAEAVKCNFFATPRPTIGTGCRRYNVLAITSYSYQKKVSDSFNEIHAVTTTPNGELFIQGDINYAGRFDPTVDGYIGYTKRFTQIEGAFGSLEALINIVNYYTAMYTPPITIQWKSFGVGHLMAGDLVSFTGLQLDNTFPNTPLRGANLPNNTAIVYLTNVSMELDPQNNDWKNNYEGEWIFVDCNNLQSLGA